MKSSIIALFAAAGLMLAAAPSFAADLMQDTPVAAPIVDNGFSFEGGYVGGFLGYEHYSDADFDLGYTAVGGEVGYNFLPSDNFLLGIEGSATYRLDGSSNVELFLKGKVGATFDNVAIYALGGVGSINTDQAIYQFGAGIEVGLTDSVSWDAEVSGREVFGNSPHVVAVQSGLRFHF